jgi:tight adherence protein C
VLGLAVSLLVAGATDPIRRRLAAGAQVKEEGIDTADAIARILRPMAGYVIPKDEWKRGQISRQLVYAGFRSPNSTTMFHGLRALTALVMPLAVLIASYWMPGLSAMKLMLYMGIGAVLGSMLPSYILDKMVVSRQKKLRKAFPDALDLLVVCVESGLGLSPALQRVADEMTVAHPELGAEFALVNAEIRAGVDRAEALKNLAERTGLADIRGLVALLVQTMKFGTSVADALRVYSEEFRDRRMQAAEERAAKIATKMIFPLIVFMFPAFFVVTAGPGVMGLIEAFKALAR